MNIFNDSYMTKGSPIAVTFHNAASRKNPEPVASASF
jgi:hypothetical protein